MGISHDSNLLSVISLLEKLKRERNKSGELMGLKCTKETHDHE